MAERNPAPRETTLLDLIQEIQQSAPCSEQAIVAIALYMIRSGRVVLSGNYRGAADRFR